MDLKMWQKPIWEKDIPWEYKYLWKECREWEEFSLASQLKQLLCTSNIKRLTEKEYRSEQGILQETENVIASP